MCGRFYLKSTPTEVAAQFSVTVQHNFPARYNICPTQPIAIIRQSERRTREFALARWGFIPEWQKKPEVKPLINARSETVHEKPTFRNAYKRRRCLVPADGYFEWRTEGGTKQPYCIRPMDGALYAFAGVWETAVDADGGEIDTVAILTTQSGRDLKSLHHREGVVIPQKDYARWLEADERDIAGLSGLLKPSPEGRWKYYAVSRNVSSYRSDGPDLIEPVRTSLFD